MNLVICMHPNNSGKFLFQVPDNITLAAGDIVLCKTRHSDKELATCATDSFIPRDADKIMQYWGTNRNAMMPVIGKLEQIMFSTEEENDNSEEVQRLLDIPY